MLEREFEPTSYGWAGGSLETLPPLEIPLPFHFWNKSILGDWSLSTTVQVKVCQTCSHDSAREALSKAKHSKIPSSSNPGAFLLAGLPPELRRHQRIPVPALPSVWHHLCCRKQHSSVPFFKRDRIYFSSKILRNTSSTGCTFEAPCLV